MNLPGGTVSPIGSEFSMLSQVVIGFKERNE
jgi:hypothetical protein